LIGEKTPRGYCPLLPLYRGVHNSGVRTRPDGSTRHGSQMVSWPGVGHKGLLRPEACPPEHQAISADSQKVVVGNAEEERSYPPQIIERASLPIAPQLSLHLQLSSEAGYESSHVVRVHHR
jgi:hypothetical protein